MSKDHSLAGLDDFALKVENSLSIPRCYYFLRMFGMANIPFLSGYNKQRILHLFANKNSPRPRRWKRYYYEVFNQGLKYSGTLGNYVDWFAFFFGGDEKHLLDHIYIPILGAFDNPVFIDVGGNIGHHSLYLSPHAASIHSFEPVPTCINEFKRKMLVAGITNCTLHEYALGEQDETLRIFCSSSFNGGTNSFLPDHHHGNSESAVVNVKQFDALDGLDLDRITLVKVDVEGFEPSVLLGMQRVLYTHRPFVICELSDTTNELLQAKQTLFTSLFPCNYLFVNADKLSSKPFKWSEGFLRRYAISDSFRGNVLCTPLERLDVVVEKYGI
jgi:FkbM family methyltransferase